MRSARSYRYGHCTTPEAHHRGAIHTSWDAVAGKVLETDSKGQGRYLDASTTNAGDGLMANATRYTALLSN